MFIRRADSPQFAVWVFNQPIADPTESLSGLMVDGHGGVILTRDTDSALIVDHGPAASVEPGMPWACVAGAGGIVAEDGSGATLEAADGSVE